MDLKSKEINHSHKIDTKIFYSKDVKEAVQKLKKEISNTNYGGWWYLNKIDEIFGEFEIHPVAIHFIQIIIAVDA